MVWAVVVLALLGGAFYFYYGNMKDAPSISRTFDGIVVSTNAENSTVIVRLLSESLPLIAHVTPDTKIQRELVTEFSDRPNSTIEVNITDIEQGERVSVEYSSLKNGKLMGVEKILLPVNKKYTREYFAKDSDFDLFLRGRVVAFDEVAGTIEIVPLDAKDNHMNGMPDTITVSLRSGFQVFSIDNLARSPILHARVPASADAIVAEGLISVVFKRSETAEAKKGITGAVLVLTPKTPTL